MSGLNKRHLPLWLLASCAVAAAPAQAEMALTDVDFELAQLDLAPAVAEPAPAELLPASLTSAAVEAELAADAGEPAALDDQRRLSFGSHVKSIKYEMGAAFAYMTAVNLLKIAKRGHVDSFSFHDEGWFGKDTEVLGVDKMVHAHNAYILSELIGARIRKKTGTTRGTAMSGALLASGLMLYSEVFDGFKGGFGYQDLVFNSLGAGFSVIRNTVPGLENKLDFRVLIIPNSRVYNFTGKEHYRQQRHLFALELGGFKRFEKSPLRFVELHAGYYGKGFTDREQERGDRLQRKLFAGVGLNLNELLFGRKPKTRFARATSQLLDYWQPPYTYVHAN
ncbi:DUF2279 domain-containing protein [Sphingomonas sp.]|uniref:DUF2279 domain-containing protein n=1 Tax=Sphingomonas sp. TaxID=28214 RepID=UPI00286DB649|nr:DUF2279 domain-containing protein [Sphingomonas sp.]